MTDLLTPASLARSITAHHQNKTTVTPPRHWTIAPGIGGVTRSKTSLQQTLGVCQTWHIRTHGTVFTKPARTNHRPATTSLDIQPIMKATPITMEATYMKMIQRDSTVLTPRTDHPCTMAMTII